MILAENRNGDQLLEFQPGETSLPPSSGSHVPLPLSLIVASHQGKVLFIYNNRRQVWELPGGMIDAGETPEAAAKRELHEETSQVVTALRFIGLAKFRLKPDDRLEFGAIYACELDTLQPFQPNDEAGQIMWWDMTSPVDDHVTEIDLKLAELTLIYQAASNDLARWNAKAQAYVDSLGSDQARIWQQFRDVMWESLGDLKGLHVLDVGCGNGWLAQQMADKGAMVWGVDGSSELLGIARARYPAIQFTQYDLSAGLPPTDQRFDRIVANMVLMDIPDLSLLLRDIRAVINPDGRFIFTMTHPVFFRQKTEQDAETGAYFSKVTGYLAPQVWDVGHTHYHRSLTAYVDLLRANKFAVSRLYEPPHITLIQDDPPQAEFYQDIAKFILFEALPVS